MSTVNSPIVERYGIPVASAGATGALRVPSNLTPSYGSSVPWYPVNMTEAQTLTGAAVLQGSIVARPFRFSQDLTLEALGVGATSSATTGLCRIGIYANKANDLYPGALLYGSPQYDVGSSLTFNCEMGLNTVLSADEWYWFVYHGGGGNAHLYTMAGSQQMWPLGSDFPPTSNMSNAGCIRTPASLATLPSNFPSGATRLFNSAFNVPILFGRFA